MRQIVWSLAVLLCADSQPVFGQEGLPGISGAWDSEVWSTEGWPLDPPYTPEGRAAQQTWASAPEDDPSNRCLVPLGRVISGPFPHEILQQDGRVTILYEYEHQVRRIFTDGRDHPQDAYPTLMGHSTGRWDGATLVVETVNMESGLFRPQGLPYTQGLRLTERYTPVDDDTRLIVEITVDDPQYYSEPWTVMKRYARFDEEIKDYECIVRTHMPAAGS